MTHFSVDHNWVDDETGSEITVYIYVKTTPGFDSDEHSLQIVAERAVDNIIDDCIYEVDSRDFD